MLQETLVDYDIAGETYEGVFVTPENGKNLPLVVIAHAWGGLGDNEVQKAKMVAEKFGYAAFAIDVYGKGKRGTTVEENMALMNPLAENRTELQARLLGGLNVAKSQANVDSSKVAAIGYCFGGLCVLDMARAGMDVAGVGSLHGLLGSDGGSPDRSITAKVLVEHGWLDPMVPAADVVTFAEEMTAAKADWQLHAHGRALHAFTTEGANNADMGTVYDADADARSTDGIARFLSELFA